MKKDLFSRLKRLFSTDVIIQNQGEGLKVWDINKIQNNPSIQNNSLLDRYQKIYTGNGSSLYGQQFNYNYQILRPQLYSDYDVMDQEAIIASALDIIADECTLRDEMHGEVLQIKSSDDGIQQKLYNLFYNVLNIEFNLWSWIRQMCKYGDFFLKLEIAEKFGVYNVIPYNAYNIERKDIYGIENGKKTIATRFIYNPDGYLLGTPNQIQPQSENNSYFDNFEVAHFRLATDVNYAPYGRSIIEPARRVFKQYTLMKDAMLIHRIMRSPERRIFYINVGSIAPEEVEGFMQKTISSMKRTPHIDPNTGEYNLKFNMQSSIEDFYIPIRPGDNTTKIDTANGLSYDGIQDVVYLREELFAALKIPKAFMGYEKDLSGKSTLAAQDIRFAHTIDRIQRIVLAELYKIAFVHLYAQGHKEDLDNFELSLTGPSIIYDQEKVELLKAQMDVIQSMIENKIMPTDWIYDKLFHLSEDQCNEFRELIIEDQKRFFRMDQIREEFNDPMVTGKTVGTPHDRAMLYGVGRYNKGGGPVPDGYENNDLGRPKEELAQPDSQQSNFGKDRTGKKSNKKDDQVGKKPNFSLNESLKQSIDKKIKNMMDESNIIDDQDIKKNISE